MEKNNRLEQIRAFLLAVILLISLVAFTDIGVNASAESEDSGMVITHVFGGAEGEWETDSDNSEGIWSYYTCFGTLNTKKADLTLWEDGEGYGNGEQYLQIKKNGFVHPGFSDPWSNLLIGLEMEADGILTAKVEATRDSVATNGGKFATENNGTLVKFMKNDDDTSLGEVAVYEVNTTFEMNPVKVQKGDVIYTQIHHQNDVGWDGATYIIHYYLDTDPSKEAPEEVKDPTEPEEGYEPVKPAAPREPKLEGDLESVNNIDDFRFAQGVRGFHYLWGKVDDGIGGLKELNVLNNRYDTNGAVEWLCIRMDGLMHPGVGEDGTKYMAVLSWIAPAKTLVDVYMDATFETVKGNGGDGVTIKIFKNETELLSFPLTAKDIRANNMNPIIAEINRIPVEEGDQVYFAVLPNENFGWDGTLTYIEINWLKETK